MNDLKVNLSQFEKDKVSEGSPVSNYYCQGYRPL